MWVHNVCQIERRAAVAVIGMKSRAMASLPPCTLQGRAATGGEAAVHHRGNWPWFIGGQSSQQELAQHWQEARQGHAVNISKRTQPSPNPHGQDATTRDQLSPCRRMHVCECMYMCACFFLVLCVPLFLYLRSVSHSSQTQKHTREPATKNDKQSP